MSDPMEALRRAQPMPRGERLARNRNVLAPKPPRLIQRCSQPLAMAWFTDDVETHAAPLALARERRRRERAEAFATLAKAHAAELIAVLLTMDAALLRLRADVVRLAIEVDEAGEHGFAERMRELATRGTG